MTYFLIYANGDLNAGEFTKWPRVSEAIKHITDLKPSHQIKIDGKRELADTIKPRLTKRGDNVVITHDQNEWIIIAH